MQVFFSEYPSDYSKYEFPYQVYCKAEYGDDWSRIYSSGFLPTRHLQNVFYLSRSCRVKLSKFGLNSENRRILKKVDDINLEIVPLDRFSYDLDVQKFCLASSQKVGKGKSIFTSNNLQKLFGGEINTNFVAVYKDKTLNVVGYALLVITGTFVHYAYPFTSVESENVNLNMGMMTKIVEWAFNQHKQYIYLGTVNTKSSLYKAQFDNFEFFTGWDWSDDITQLKARIFRLSGHLLGDKEYIDMFDLGNILVNSPSVIRVRYK